MGRHCDVVGLFSLYFLIARVEETATMRANSRPEVDFHSLRKKKNAATDAPTVQARWGSADPFGLLGF